MTAKEMFETLGYKQTTNSDNFIEYIDDSYENGDFKYKIYNPRTKIISFTETPCVYRYDIEVTNVYIPREVGEFSFTKQHEIYATKLLTAKELDSAVANLDLEIETERFVDIDEYE